MIWDVLDQNERNTILIKALWFLSISDHNLNQEEFNYLIYACNQLQIDPEFLKSLDTHNEDFNEILPSNEQDRMNLLYHLLFMVNADNSVNEFEEKAIYHLAFRLGFHEDMTRDFLSILKSHTLQNLPSQAFIDIIKKYKN